MTAARSRALCQICGNATAPGPEAWLCRCRSCGFWMSSRDRDERLREESVVDEAQRRSGLQALRMENNRAVLGGIARIRPLQGLRLLDVGSAYGWFLEAAAEQGADAVGVEPEAAVAEVAIRGGLKVRKGYFPEAIPAGERFDAIVFNDVLEHLPDPAAALRESWNLLNPSGVLVVNIPLATGALYRIASLLSLIGVRFPLHRLWQVDYRSPHLSYFSAENLAALAARAGFAPAASQRLATVSHRGMLSRLKMGGLSTSLALPMVVALIPFFLLQHLLPADIRVFYFQKVDASGS